jgi:HEAT repeat protein
MSMEIYSEISREQAAAALAGSSEQDQVAAIYELSQRSEAEVAEYLDYIVSMMNQQSSADVKTAVCSAIRNGGSSASVYVQTVASLLGDASGDVKYEACMTLASMGPPASGYSSQVAALLEDQKDVVRFAACTALGGIEATETCSKVAKLLDDKSPEVVGAACLALGKFGSDGKKFAEKVASKLGEQRTCLQAIYALGSMDDDGAKYCEKVAECLEDEDSDIRLAAAQTLGSMADAVSTSGAASAKVAALLSADDGKVKNAAILTAGYMGAKAADKCETLLELLADDFSEPAANALTVGGCRSRLPPACRKTNCAAACALGMIVQSGAEVDIDPIVNSVSDLIYNDDWETRLAACEALAMMGDKAKEAGTKISSIFDDDKYAVRARAAYAAGKIGDADVASGLSDLLADSSPSVKEEALLALGALGEEGAEFIEKVFEKVLDYNPAVRGAACKSLGMMGEKGMYYAGVVAQRLLEPEAPIVKIAAIEALGDMQDHGAVYAEVVADYLQDPLPQVRAAAALSLGKMGTEAEPYTGSIKALMNSDMSEEVQKSAAEAMSTLGV